MQIGQSGINTLLGGSAQGQSNAGVYGAVIGSKQDLTSSVLGDLTASQSSNALTGSQAKAIDGLRAFVDQNITGKDAENLYESINGLEKFLKTGNDSANLDPAFSLLASSSFSISVDYSSAPLLDLLV